MTRGHHDMGGRAAGPIDRTEHDHAHWEKEVDAIYQLLGGAGRKLLGVDELRRGIESLAPADYDRMSYYARWIASIRANLVEKGVLTRAEIDDRLAELRARPAPHAAGAGAPQ